LCCVFIKRSKSNTAQRTTHKAENWKKLEILWILFALGVAALYLYLKSPSVIGAAGERRVNATLSRKLAEQDYTIIEDLTLPTLQGTTQIDHIVLSRFGVFVIETKNMSGWIFGGENQARWTQVMRRHKSQFQNPLRQNYLHVRVVQDLLGIRLDQLENLVVFVGSAKPKTEMPWNVFWSRGDLYTYIAAQRTVQFTDTEVREFADKLRNSTLQASKEQRHAHVQHVKEKVSQKETDLTACPRCGEKMIERTSRKTGKTFFGCSRYPKCQGTRKVK
jgi:restriction system protein